MADKNRMQTDVLRVTQYILRQGEERQSFSVNDAAKSKELNGIDVYKIADIMRSICMDPDSEGSLIKYTKVDNENSHNNPARWQLNAQTYFSYLSYLSLEQSKKANVTSHIANVLACIAIVVSISVAVYQIS